MHVKLQKLLLRMSRIGMYAMILHYSFFTLAMANNTEAQRKKLHEIQVNTNPGNQSFLSFLDALEESSGFIFAYSKQEVRNKTVHIVKSEWAMDELLKEVSLQTELSFRRVNEIITVRKIRAKASAPAVTD